MHTSCARYLGANWQHGGSCVFTGKAGHLSAMLQGMLVILPCLQARQSLFLGGRGRLDDGPEIPLIPSGWET